MKRLISILLLLCCLSASASSVVVVTFSFTNAAGTTNGQSLTVNGDTRTFTNAVFIASSQILTNNTPGGSAQNTWLQLDAFHFTGFNLSSPYPTAGATNVSIASALQSDPPTSPTVSISGNWGTFTITTNRYIELTAVRIPVSGEPSAPVQTNVASALATAINSSADTNGIAHATNSDLASFVAQSPMTNSFNSTNNTTHGYWQLTNDFTGSFVRGTNDSLISSNAATGNTVTISNGVVTANTFVGSISGNVNTATNAIWATNFISVASLDIPIGAWFTNNCGNGADVTAANATSITNAGDGIIFATGSTTNQARTRISLPYDWNAGTIQIGTIWLCTGTNSASAAKTNFVVQYKAASVGPADRLDSLSFGSALFMTNNCNPFPYEQGTKAITNPLTVGNSPAANKGIVLDIQVCGNAAGTTETNSSLILADVQVYYQATNQISFPASSP